MIQVGGFDLLFGWRIFAGFLGLLLVLLLRARTDVFEDSPTSGLDEPFAWAEPDLALEDGWFTAPQRASDSARLCPSDGAPGVSAVGAAATGVSSEVTRRLGALRLFISAIPSAPTTSNPAIEILIRRPSGECTASAA